MEIHDILGVGFGPSNIALAIALQERYGDASKKNSNVKACFLEKQPAFAWHPNMLLSHAHMQISFLKDLATPRNPKSDFSFLNYLHSKGRLQDFINLKTFFPSRHEFNDYLSWCAGHFDNQCEYDRDVFEILPEMQGNTVAYLRVRSRDNKGVIHEHLTRSLVISAGGYGYVPDSFTSLKDNTRVFHSSVYLKGLNEQKSLDRVAVIGAGQSAAEIFLDLHENQGANVDLVTRAWAFKPSDDSPFVNEIFNPEFTDYVYNNSTGRRQELLTEYKSTNYAAPDLDLIKQIYDVFYRQKVTGSKRHALLRRHEVIDTHEMDDGIRLKIKELDSGNVVERNYDAVVLATGYQRNLYKKLLAPVADYLDDFSVNRDYQLNLNEANKSQFEPMVFLQGACEPSHGLSDTLLSIMAIRTDEICKRFEQHVLNKSKAKAAS